MLTNVTKGLALPACRVHAGAAMNRHVQVMLDPSDRRRARRRAAESGITLAEYVRRLVRQDLEGWTPEADVVAAIEIDDSGGSDIATYGDRSLGEAVAARFAKTNTPSR